MADTWAVPGYGVPAYDQTELERIRMMQKLLMEQQTQNLAPQMPAQPDASMPQPDTGRNDPVLDANQNVLMRDAMMQQRQQAAPAPAPVSPQQAPVRMPQPEMGDRRDAPQDPMQLTARRAAIGASLTPQQQVMLKPGPIPTDVAGVSPPAQAQQPATGLTPPAQPTPDGPAPGAMPVGAITPQTPDGPTPGAMPVKRTPFMGEGDQNQAQSVPGEPMNIVPKAMENVTQEPQGFLAKAQSWLDKVGSVFTVQTKGQDPNAINPAYGVPNAMVWNAQRNALFNAGVVLMAAGMPNTPQGRARIIQQLGPALSNVTKDIYNMAQSRLMYAKASGESGQWRVDQDETGVFQIDPKTGKRDYIEKASDVNVAMPVEEQIKIWQNPQNPDKSLLRKATINAEMIKGYDSAEQLLLAGIYAGRTGAAKEFAVSTLRAFGFADANSENVQALIRTQEYRTKLKDAVLASMQALGGNDSNQELETLTKMVGADTALEPEALLSVVRSGRAKELAAYKNNRKFYDTMVERVSPANRPFIEGLAPPEIDVKKYEQGNTSKNTSADAPEKKVVVNGKEYRVKVIDGVEYVLINGKWEPL